MARRARFVRPARKTKIWTSTFVASTTMAGSSDVLLGVSNAALLALRPFTILRTHIELMYGSDQAVATEEPFGRWGMIVVKETASAIGVTAVPAPGQEVNADWFIYRPVSNQFNFASAVGFDANGMTHYDIDSKAMRKVGDDDDVIICATQLNAVGSRIVTQGRMLIQLH